jgi:hypothetical protein
MKKWEEPAIWMLGVENTATGNGSEGGTTPPPGMPNKVAGSGDDMYVDGGHWEEGWEAHS